MGVAKQIITSESQNKHFKVLAQAAQCNLKCLMGIKKEGKKGKERRENGEDLKRRGEGGKGDCPPFIVKQ